MEDPLNLITRFTHRTREAFIIKRDAKVQLFLKSRAAANPIFLYVFCLLTKVTDAAGLLVLMIYFLVQIYIILKGYNG